MFHYKMSLSICTVRLSLSSMWEVFIFLSWEMSLFFFLPCVVPAFISLYLAISLYIWPYLSISGLYLSISGLYLSISGHISISGLYLCLYLQRRGLYRSLSFSPHAPPYLSSSFCLITPENRPVYLFLLNLSLLPKERYESRFVFLFRNNPLPIQKMPASRPVCPSFERLSQLRLSNVVWTALWPGLWQ